MTEVEETLNRLKTHKNVQGIVIVNSEGALIRTTYLNEKKDEGEKIAKLIPALATKAKTTIRDIDPSNELTFMRLKTKGSEIMVAPDKEFMLIVVQGPKL